MIKNRRLRDGLAGQLRTVRHAADLTQHAVAERIGMGRETVLQAENGRGLLASFVRIAAHFDHEIGARSLPPAKHLGERLAALRQRRGISCRSLALLAGVSAPTVAAIEAGRAGHLEPLERVAQALGAGLRLGPVGASPSFWTGAGVSSTHHSWTTPPGILARLYPLVGGLFDLDPCSPGGARPPVRSRIRFTAEDDGLVLPWIGSVFVNPPYGRALGLWMQKARAEAEHGRAQPVISLVPARPDTRWWHDHVVQRADVFLLRGRLRFGGANSAAPFPSALVIWSANRDLREALQRTFFDAWYVPKAKGNQH